MKKSIFILFMLFSLSGIVNATPLKLDYSVNDIGGGLYNYDFSLVLDNNDSSWSSGQGWRWFIFGDAPSGETTPLTNFTMDSGDLPVGPWTSLNSTSGGHNGPTFSDVLDYWIPLSIGETLSWSGTSTANLFQGELLFSTLAGTLNGAIAANFEVATRVSPVPVPAAAWLFGSALLGFFGFSRRKVNA